MGLPMYRWEVELNAISDVFWDHVFDVLMKTLADARVELPLSTEDIAAHRSRVTVPRLRSTDLDLEMVVDDNGLSAESVFPITFELGADFKEIASIYAANVLEQFRSEQSLIDWRASQSWHAPPETR